MLRAHRIICCGLDGMQTYVKEDLARSSIHGRLACMCQ